MGNIFDNAAKADREKKAATVTKNTNKSKLTDEMRTEPTSTRKQGRFNGRKAVNFGIDAENDYRLAIYRVKTGKTLTEAINEALVLFLNENGV